MGTSVPLLSLYACIPHFNMIVNIGDDDDDDDKYYYNDTQLMVKGGYAYFWTEVYSVNLY